MTRFRGDCLTILPIVDLATNVVSYPTKVRLIYKLAQAVEHMLEEGFVYGDVKSDNALVDDGGHIQLTDFGFAAIRARSASSGYASYQKGPGATLGRLLSG